MMKRIFYIAIFGCIFSIHAMDQLNKAPIQQIIGTQGFRANHQFTAQDIRVEQAEKARQMGSSMFKTTVRIKDFTYERRVKLHPNQPSENMALVEQSDVDTDGFIKSASAIDKILSMGFTTFFFWWRSDNQIWKYGLSATDKAIEYQMTYNFALSLLERKSDIPLTFHIGHWEGDWYLISSEHIDANPDDIRIQGMIDWLNIRQKAIDAARQDMLGKTKSCIYHYTEVNRVIDAMYHGKKRVVNAVLPHTDVDYVSYSSYDTTKSTVPADGKSSILEAINYIDHQIIGEKPGITRPRVFIGEFAISARLVDWDPVRHDSLNCELSIILLESGVPYILYWQMYNNERRNDGNPEGYWLIDEDEKKWPFYYTLQKLFKDQASFANVRQDSINWLKNHLQQSKL